MVPFTVAAAPDPADQTCAELLTRVQTKSLTRAEQAGRRVRLFGRQVNGVTKVVALVGTTGDVRASASSFAAFDRVAFAGPEVPRDWIRRAYTRGRDRLRGTASSFAAPPLSLTNADSSLGPDQAIDLGQIPRSWRRRLADHAVSIHLGIASLAALTPWLVPDAWRPAAWIGAATFLAYQAVGFLLGRVKGDRPVFEFAFPLAGNADHLRRAGVGDALDRTLADPAIRAVVTVVSREEFKAFATHFERRGFAPLPITNASAVTPLAEESAAVDEEPSIADVSALRITPELERLAAEDPRDRNLVAALPAILGRLTPANVTTLARRLTERPEPSAKDRRRIETNPYFLEHPERRTPETELNLLDVRASLGAALDDYAAGLLATLISAGPRAARGLTMTELAQKAPAARLGRTQSLMTIPEYRAALIEVIDAARARPEVLAAMNADEVGTSKPVTAADLEKLRAELANRKPVSLRATFIVDRLLVGIQNDLFRQYRLLGLGIDHEDADQVRGRLLLGAKAYFKKILPVTTPGVVVGVLFSVLFYDVPPPLAAEVLKQTIVDSARTALLPLKARRSRVTPTVDAGTPAGPAAPAAEPVMKDLFAPPPERRKRERIEETPSPEVEPLKKAPPRIAPDLDLRSFTGDGTPFVASELTRRRTYEVIFANGPANVVQRVEFGGRALEWMNQNPHAARGIVRALCAGGSDDQSHGIKRLRTRSRRYKGQLFELKIESDHRPFLIFIKDRQSWQVISIVHKDDQDRAARWVKALDPE